MHKEKKAILQKILKNKNIFNFFQKSIDKLFYLWYTTLAVRENDRNMKV